MPDLLLLPNPAAPLVGPGGVVSPEWYAYLQALEERSETGAVTLPELEAAIAAIATALGSPDGTVAGIPESAGGITQIIGTMSVKAYQDGDSLVRVQLDGDKVSPASGTVYGMVSGGVKGWRDAVFSVNGYTGDVVLWEVVEVADTTATIAQENRDKLLRFTDAGTKTLTVEAEADTAIVQDSRFHIRNAGAGLLTISPGAGVTINADALTVPENGTATLIRVAEDVWDLIPYGGGSTGANLPAVMARISLGA